MTIPENYFIYISIFLVAIYVVMMIIGYMKGFLYELVNLVYTAAALALAYFAAPVFSGLYPLFDIGQIDPKYEFLAQTFNLNSLLNTVAYFIIIFLILKLLYIFISLLLKFMNKIPVIGKFNQILGAVFGFFNATLIILSLSMLLSLPIIKNGNEIREKTLFKYIHRYSDEALTYIINKIGTSNIKGEIDNFNINDYREDFKQWIISISNSDE